MRTPSPQCHPCGVVLADKPFSSPVGELLYVYKRFISVVSSLQVPCIDDIWEECLLR